MCSDLVEKQLINLKISQPEKATNVDFVKSEGTFMSCWMVGNAL